MKSRVVLMGPPGSGKGTLAAGLTRRLGYKHVSSGQLLRREAELGSEVGEQAQRFLDKGQLVPDEVVLAFMKARLGQIVGDGLLLLDGFPRTVGQAKALDLWLDDIEMPLDLVLLLKCPSEVIVSRVGGRRQCAQCGAGYHLVKQPPRVEGRCDLCGGELIQRSDDSEAILLDRLETYAREISALVDYYGKQRKLMGLDASGSLESVVDAAIAVLSE
jgi:adenylate kinase